MKLKMMHSWIELDTQAFRNNLAILKERAEFSEVMAVLKSNAYGHGFEETYKAIGGNSFNFLGVNYVYEARKLRDLGFSNQILVMGPVPLDELDDAFELRANVCLSHKKMLNFWLHMKNKPCVHIKVDTGLSRQGFSFAELPGIIPSLISDKNLVRGIMSHFACVEDVTRQDFANRQLSLLSKSHDLFIGAGFSLKAHIAASAAALVLPTSHLHMVRIGISLYGFWPSNLTKLSFHSQNSRLLNLRPALSWKSKVASIRTLLKGDAVGYGCAFQAPRRMKIAVIPVGYFEGYPRIAGNCGQAYVICKGIRCRLVGRISMNMMTIDISEVFEAKEDDVVTLIGSDSGDTVSAEQLAEWSHTIQYQIVTNIHPNIPRLQINLQKT